MAVCNMRDHMHLFVAAFIKLRLDGEIHFEKIIEIWQYSYRTLIPLADTAFNESTQKANFIICSSTYERGCWRDRIK